MEKRLIKYIKGILPTGVVSSELRTTMGLLYVPNDNMRIGPKYLISINFPLHDDEKNWTANEMYLHGGHKTTCEGFFSDCNGFSFGRCFSAPGILTHDPYDHEEHSALNVPYDLGTVSYYSYPQFAPEHGYFISALHLADSQKELCDVVLPDGRIVYGEFRKNEEVMGQFADVQHWISDRVPRALNEMGLM